MEGGIEYESHREELKKNIIYESKCEMEKHVEKYVKYIKENNYSEKSSSINLLRQSRKVTLDFTKHSLSITNIGSYVRTAESNIKLRGGGPGSFIFSDVTVQNNFASPSSFSKTNMISKQEDLRTVFNKEIILGLGEHRNNNHTTKNKNTHAPIPWNVISMEGNRTSVYENITKEVLSESEMEVFCFKHLYSSHLNSIQLCVLTNSSKGSVIKHLSEDLGPFYIWPCLPFMFPEETRNKIYSFYESFMKTMKGKEKKDSDDSDSDSDSDNEVIPTSVNSKDMISLIQTGGNTKKQISIMDKLSDKNYTECYAQSLVSAALLSFIENAKKSIELHIGKENNKSFIDCVFSVLYEQLYYGINPFEDTSDNNNNNNTSSVYLGIYSHGCYCAGSFHDYIKYEYGFKTHLIEIDPIKGIVVISYAITDRYIVAIYLDCSDGKRIEALRCIADAVFIDYKDVNVDDVTKQFIYNILNIKSPREKKKENEKIGASKHLLRHSSRKDKTKSKRMKSIYDGMNNKQKAQFVAKKRRKNRILRTKVNGIVEILFYACSCNVAKTIV